MSGLSNVVNEQYTANYTTIGTGATATVGGVGGGAKGDFITGLFIVPSSVSPSAISLTDGANTFTVFAGGANSLSNLVPFLCPLGIKSVNAAWQISVGSGASVVVTGGFT